MSERTEFPMSSHGKPDVTGWVIGVVDDEKNAAGIAHAVEAAGFPADHVVVESGAAALLQLQTQQASQQQEGLLARAFDTIEEAFEGREPARQAFESEAQRGHTFVGVHLSQDDQIDGLRNIYVEHGARTVYVFRPIGIGQLA
jgi:hypothetical protein